MRPQPPFGTRVEEHDGVAVMALSGELDIATAPILRENLAPFEGNGVSTIVLDLRDLTSSTRRDCSPSLRPGGVQ